MVCHFVITVSVVLVTDNYVIINTTMPGDNTIPDIRWEKPNKTIIIRLLLPHAHAKSGVKQSVLSIQLSV